MMYDIKVDPPLQFSSQEPSVSSKSPMEDMALDELIIYAKKFKLNIQPGNYISR